jgi:SPP1 gp7 family putative phage head morphogenesis protein
MIRNAVVTQDVFGLKAKKSIFTANVSSGLQPGAFAFRTNPEKVDEFMGWLSVQVDKEILEVLPGTGRTVAGAGAWTDVHIQSSYKRGMQRADSEMRKAGLTETGTYPLNIDAAFNTPVHADRVGLLYTRAFGELKGVAARLEQKVSRVLTAGMAEGRSPLSIALDLSEQVGLERSYAKTLARTEVVRAHHAANINVYKDAGIEGVVVKAEWSSAGFGVCPDCEDLNGRVFTIDEISGLIPLHPNCRCVALPLPPGVAGKGEFKESAIGEEYRRKDRSFKTRGLFEKKAAFKKPKRAPGKKGFTSPPRKPKVKKSPTPKIPSAVKTPSENNSFI